MAKVTTVDIRYADMERNVIATFQHTYDDSATVTAQEIVDRVNDSVGQIAFRLAIPLNDEPPPEPEPTP